MAGAKWDTIESDPGIFTTMLESMGVKGASVEEIYSLDSLPPCLGLLFLFQHAGKASPPTLRRAPPPGAPAPWFARQTVHNACGTQALLHILLNQPAAAAAPLELGDTLSAFRSFTDGLPPAERGSCFEQCEAIRTTHNSFARPEPFLREDRVARPGEKGKAPFHFLAYVELCGAVYELDGLAAEGAVCLGTPAEAAAAAAAAAAGAAGGGASAAQPGAAAPPTWLSVARAAVEARIASYASSGSGEIRFSLLAVVLDPRIALTRALCASAATLERVHALLLSHGEAVEPPDSILARCGVAPADVSAPPPPTPHSAAEAAAAEAAEDAAGASALRARYAEAEGALQAVCLAREEEADKRRAWASEHVQRRHNFVPFLMALLTGMADRGVLAQEYEAARERYKGRLERARREGRDAADDDDA